MFFYRRTDKRSKRIGLKLTKINKKEKKLKKKLLKKNTKKKLEKKNVFYKDVRTHVQLKTIVRNLTKNLKNKNKTKIKRASK